MVFIVFTAAWLQAVVGCAESRGAQHTGTSMGLSDDDSGSPPGGGPEFMEIVEGPFVGVELHADAGFAACSEAFKSIADHMSAVVQRAAHGCEKDSDCTSVRTGTWCTRNCGSAVLRINREAVRRVRSELADECAFLRDEYGCSGPPNVTCAVPVPPSCIDGVCRKGQ
ncbi:MAG: hypothetical protein OXR73_05070 [Myxococcales bacterium]|nr:hypothetical protein [Myxococcales bacterium]